MTNQTRDWQELVSTPLANLRMTAIKIIHGPNDDLFDCVGASIGLVRRNLRDAFNLDAEALPFVNGDVVSDDFQLRPRDVLEFIHLWGKKGGDSDVPIPRLPITEYGTVDISHGVPEGLVHVNLPRLGATCKRLGIEYGKALLSWNEYGRRGNKRYYPSVSGIVIRYDDLPRLEEALEIKYQKQERKVTRLPVLAALFTLNRRAKRCRDLAQTYYQEGMHGFAGDMKREKNRIYDLKGQVLHHMVEAGVLVGGKFHRFEFGNWAEILEGDGYRFHRPCPPQESLPETELIESIESKPKDASEPTLAIAYEVIERFLSDKRRVAVYEWPPKARPARHRWYDEDDDDDYDDEQSYDDDEGRT